MKFDPDSYREIADSLVRNKSRSLLTGFGIFWGIFMLLSLVGGGGGLKAVLMENFAGFASNSVFIAPNRTTKPYKGFREGREWTLTQKDAVRLKRLMPELDVVSPLLTRWNQTAVFGTKTASGTVKGIYADYEKIEAPKMKYGRYLNDSDILMNRKVCVIGETIYHSLFPEGGDPCGKFIQVGSVYFQVVGVDFSSGNVNIQGSADKCIYIPLPIMQRLYNYGTGIGLLAMTAKNGIPASSLEPRIRRIVAREHTIDPTDKQAIFILNTEQLFSIMDNLFLGVNFLIWLVGLGTLFAGAIGVSNIMMVTVKERTTEIGIRRAIGATPRDILSQIVAESVALTLIAGSGGIVFATFILNAVEMASGKAVFQVNFWTAVGAALLLVVLGSLAGLAPASRAMRIKPVDAMRDE